MSANPYHPPFANVADHPSRSDADVTWGRAAKVWWSFMWRMVVFGGLAGAVLGFVLGFIMGAAGIPQQQIVGVTTWAGMVIAIPVGIWTVRAVLRKSWADFRIVLVPRR